MGFEFKLCLFLFKLVFFLVTVSGYIIWNLLRVFFSESVLTVHVCVDNLAHHQKTDL